MSSITFQMVMGACLTSIQHAFTSWHNELKILQQKNKTIQEFEKMLDLGLQVIFNILCSLSEFFVHIPIQICKDFYK